mmetsp:Transcript_38845/g.28731  ORF Transcript_38845/g.28731 Transcript_38845/m.28731 type:complete len:128 (+) Transcript_38845:80-463(+)
MIILGILRIGTFVEGYGNHIVDNVIISIFYILFGIMLLLDIYEFKYINRDFYFIKTLGGKIFFYLLLAGFLTSDSGITSLQALLGLYYLFVVFLLVLFLIISHGDNCEQEAILKYLKLAKSESKRSH